MMAGPSLHGKSAWKLENVGVLLKNLEQHASLQQREEALKAALEVVREEAKRSIPRDSGLAESEIQVLDVKPGEVAGVGIRKDSPAFVRGMVTEYGSERVQVGTPENPRTSWPAKSKSTASMPWLRPALIRSRERAYEAMRRALRKK